MEKILVGMDSKTTHLWSVIYVLNLAKRIRTKIFVLWVTEPETTPKARRVSKDTTHPIKIDLEKLITDGRLEGAVIEYYLASGSFKEELIKFIQEKRINLLIIDLPQSGRKIGGERFSEILKEIKLRTDCRIEVVHQKNIVKSG